MTKKNKNDLSLKEYAKISLTLQVENNIRWLEQHKEVIHTWLRTKTS